MTKIAAFDIATTTGFAIGDGTTLPKIGHFKLPSPISGARGPMFTAFRHQIIHLLATEQPDLVVGEQPILPRKIVKLETTMILQGLWAIFEQVADARHIACANIDVSTIKKGFAGSGDADKADMVHVARKIGLTIAVHDEADAVGCWLAAGRLRWSRAICDEWDKRIYASRGALL